MRIHYDAVAVIEGKYEDDMVEMDNIIYQVVKTRYVLQYDNTIMLLQDYYDYLEQRGLN